jgi:hypothetical protein
MVDAFERAAVDISLATPDWGEDPALPPGRTGQLHTADN